MKARNISGLSLFSSSLSAILFLVSVSEVFPQSFPISESGKITYYEVVEVDSMNQATLFVNALDWIKSLPLINDEILAIEKDSIQGKVSGQVGFVVYSQSGVLKKMSGKFRYSISIEVKDNKYRYQFSDFVFHYFKQDRNYVMSPTGKTKPLEEVDAQGWQKLWTHHRKDTHARMMRHISSLKTKMPQQKVNNHPASKPVKAEW